MVESFIEDSVDRDDARKVHHGLEKLFTKVVAEGREHMGKEATLHAR